MSDRKQDLLNLNARIQQTEIVVSQLRAQRSIILASIHADHTRPMDSLGQGLAQPDQSVFEQDYIDGPINDYDESFEGSRR